MVSFSCENCGDVVPKKKLDSHSSRCYGASFTCLDCMKHFRGTEYREHNSCISEAQKYEGKLYRPKEAKAGKGEAAIAGTLPKKTPRKAYVEDAPETPEDAWSAGLPTKDERGARERGVKHHPVPPKAPTPPPANPVDVFEFLVKEEKNAGLKNGSPPAGAAEPEPKEEDRGTELPLSQIPAAEPHRMASGGQKQLNNGVGVQYGSAPVQGRPERYDSTNAFPLAPYSFIAPPLHADPPELNAFKTPVSVSAVAASRRRVKDVDKHQPSEPFETEKSSKKRKRGTVADPDVPRTGAPLLHSGLTGGLDRLLKLSTQFYEQVPEYPDAEYTRRRNGGAEKAIASIETTPGMGLKKPRSERQDQYDEERTRAAEGTDHRKRSRKEHNEDDSHKRKHRRHRDRSASAVRTERTYHRRATNALEQPTQRTVPSTAVTRRRNLEDEGQLVTSSDRAALFMSLVTKGPESESGMSMNRVLKMYHKEVLGEFMYDYGEGGVISRQERDEHKEEEEKELWRGLRVRRNERGEVVLRL